MFSGNSFSGDDTEEQKVCVLVLVRFGSFPGCPKDGYLIAVALFYTRSSFTFFDKYTELQLWMLHWYSLVVGICFRHSLSDCIRNGLCLQFPGNSVLLSKVLHSISFFIETKDFTSSE
jgi:hypothetical protein